MLGERLALLALPSDDARDDGECDEHHADATGRPLGRLGVEELDDHDHAEEQDGPVGTVLQEAVLGERAGAHQVDGHGPHPDGTRTETRHDQQDTRRDGERADDAVEAEAGVEHLEVEERSERRHADLDLVGHRHRLGSLVVLLLEHGPEQVETHVQGDTQHGRDEHGGALGLVDGEEQHGSQHEHHEDRDVVELAQRSESTLERGEPVHVLLLVEEVADRDHQQERTTESLDGRPGLGQLGRVELGVVQRRLDDIAEPESTGELDDNDRKCESNDEHRDEDADSHEDGLPERRHGLQDLGIHHRVVEAEGDLQHREDGDRHDSLEAIDETDSRPDDDGQDGSEPEGPHDAMGLGGLRVGHGSLGHDGHSSP